MTPLTFQNFTLAGVVLCVVAAIFSAVVLPAIAAPTFFTASCILLALAFWTHRSQFGVQEYERNTMKYTLRNAASGIVIIIVILGILGFFMFNKYNSAGPSMPAMAMPTVGGGLVSVAKNAVSRIKDVMRSGTMDL
jgi:hypothetical protein